MRQRPARVVIIEVKNDSWIKQGIVQIAAISYWI